MDIFYKGSDGCFLVFDLTDRKTYEKVIDWRDQFLSKTDLGPEDNFHFVVLGNKCDLENREVTKEEAEQFFQSKHGLSYFEVSAKEDKNIETVFKESIPKFYAYHK